MSNVLIVDDQGTSRMIMEEVVRALDEVSAVHSFACPIDALNWCKSEPVDLVLTDYKMPHMDGAEFTRWLRQIPACSDLPVVVITGVEDKKVRYRALEAGATDFLTKPIDHNECRARCKNLLALRRQQRIIKDRAKWLERQVEQAVDETRLREKETLLRLARAGEYRDEGTGNHVLRIARYARLIAAGLGLDQQDCDLIELAAPMHDIGKIGIPDSILLKAGPLNANEWAVMRTHTTIGYEILRDSPSQFLQTGAIIALSHHERFDGSGYPHGLRGEAIPLPARIVAVADCYDALVSDRPYKRGWSMQDAIDHLLEQKGSQLDPACVDAFLARADQLATIQSQLDDAKRSCSR